MNLRIDFISSKAARFVCENWHYSRVMPNSKTFKFGVWEDGDFKGAIIFGVGATNNLLKPYGLSNIQGCELVRVALRNHQTTVSRIVTIAMKILKKENPGLRLIVSFADPTQGHHGGIYQAMNWVYTGVTAGGTEYLFRGKWVHSRTIGAVSKKLGVVRTTLADGTRKSSLKHRYLYPLDDDMADRVKKLALKYPKRAAEVNEITDGFHPSNGGATPTQPLQICAT